MSEYPVTGLASGSGLTYNGSGGEVVQPYRLVYLGGSDAWYNADADNAARMPVLGLATGGLGVGQKGKILLHGMVNYNGWTWTAGGAIYASYTPGLLTQTAPVIAMVVGFAVTATTMYFVGAASTGYTGALTVQGDVNIGANGINFTNTRVDQGDADTVAIRDAADTDYKSLIGKNLYFLTRIYAQNDACYISPYDVDGNYLYFGARNNGVGLVEVARLQNAAAPAFCVGNSGAIANDDFASVADQVKLGNYDIAAGRRTLALATEEAVAVEAALASTHTLAVRINGATWRIMLTNA